MAVVKGLDDGLIFVILGVVMELSSILETFVISFCWEGFFSSSGIWRERISFLSSSLYSCSKFEHFFKCARHNFALLETKQSGLVIAIDNVYFRIHEKQTAFLFAFGLSGLVKKKTHDNYVLYPLFSHLI